MEHLHFLALGGAREIGANSYFLKLGGHGLLIDSGLHPEKTGWDAFPRADLLDPYSVNTFIITHSHTDHLGAVPFMLQSQPQARVIATPETIELARIMLSNSASLLPKQHPAEVIEKLPFYSQEKLDEIIKNIEPRRFHKTFKLDSTTPEINVTLYMSGHILGAGGMLIEVDGKRIFHTGDTSLHPQTLIAGAELPDGPVDVLITECTNGKEDAYLSHSREIELERFLSAVGQTLEGGGSVLIPVFAMGKMQEALVMVNDAMREQKIPTVDIYTGGMARLISEIYDKVPFSESRLRNDEKLADIPQTEIPRRDGIFTAKFFKEPSIVLASSGMMQEGTSSYLLAQRWLRKQNFAICFIGYTDPRTPGYVVSHAEAGTRIKFGNMKRDVPVRSRIERFRFSAHARREELLEIVRRLQPKHILLTHGDIEAMNTFAEAAKQEAPGVRVSAPEIGKWYKMLE
ncbi:MAG TPA: MBL fold metallo-hydrolase [Candidatus Kapabacteria bacterium]|nr:MBL fold metallo-hydrolase [Candidatus Kapabacteria bacterium]